MRNALIPLACLALAACGTTPGVNSDVPNVLYAGAARSVPQAPASVTIVDVAPSVPGAIKAVSGVSCRNKMWDPAPSEANALALMKQQAAQAGFDAIYGVDVKPDPRALAMNCWSAIRATGTAFKMPVPAGPPA